MEEKEECYRSMMQSVERYCPSADMDEIRRAYEYADKEHAGQLRKSGEPYIIHPLAVAEIVAEIGLDTDAIVAALLHDCLEDTDASYEDISRMFGQTVAELVEGVTKLTRVQYSTMEEQQMENLRKMFMAMSKDIRVILIKIADRLHNTRTLQYQTPAKQISKSMETMEIYAPLAHRLGMQKIKWELEDVSLQYLDPDGYQQIIDYLKAHEASSNEFMSAIQKKITDRLASVGIHGSIYGRVKHTYSIYRKMRAQNKTIEELYDLYAFRVIVDNIADCYNVLGHIHDLFNPIPGRFKDYISTPKPNMYQSLHTTVIGSQGIPFEVQIRTWEMHQTAEYGVAAHWKYKQNVGDGTEKEFEWVRRLLENQQDVEADDYIHSLKVDMFDDEVFVFTPKGKVISLPSGSTPIDFAYAIHSAVGNSMIGAKINNRIAGYDVTLHNGDIVEVLTSKSAKGPSRDWLNICQSNQARIKIKQWFKREKRDENIVRGKASFESELRHIGIDPDVLANEELLPVILKKVSFDSLDDMYAAIGYGGLTALKAVGRIRDELTKASRAQTKELPGGLKTTEAAQNATGVIVEDIGSCMIKFSRCCTPVPGDDIVGFITKGYGVSVHRRDCPNAKNAASPAQSGRWVKVSWAASPEAVFNTSLELEANDRDGLMLDVATILTSLRMRVSEMNARSVGGGKAVITISFPVHNLSELTTVSNRLHGISGVTAVHRGVV
jgi:guanosine-3',5'-bis(diphosphate) 3'-pyrophosphohydrolase